MDLSDIRVRIDDIDSKLLPLFLERMDLAREVAEYKKANSLPILNKGREREILERVSRESGELEIYAHRLYSTIFELSRSYQETLNAGGSKIRSELERVLASQPGSFPKTGTIACQGVEGAYSQMAADHLFPRGNLMFFNTFEAVFDAVENGLCDFGVVPIENSSNGSVRATYDLLRTKNVRIVRSSRLCIRHELLAKPGTTLADITKICSHEQALGQCSRFIGSLGSRVEAVDYPNTAMAAEYAASAEAVGVAAIASHSSGKLYGLVPIAEDIQNSDNNYTRFVCIARDTVIYPGSDRVSLVLTCAHKPGALHEVLAKFASLGVNLIKLESCPMVGHDFEFRFFFELQADVTDPRIVAMLESLERECEEFVFLGSYLEA